MIVTNINKVIMLKIKPECFPHTIFYLRAFRLVYDRNIADITAKEIVYQKSE